MLLALGLATAIQTAPGRFQSVAPFPQLPWIKIDQRWAGGSFADEACRQKNLQGRVLWIDGSANLDAMNTEDKIVRLIAKIKSVGFNTIVLDVKPIVGRTIYPSALTEQMTAWKGKTMPKGFDPALVFRRETSRKNLSFLVSLNAFSEGHSYSERDKGKPDSQFGDPGWGYKHPEYQSVLYRPRAGVRFGGSNTVLTLCPTTNPAQWTEATALFDKVPIPDTDGTFYVLDPHDTLRAVGAKPPQGLDPGWKVIVTKQKTFYPGIRADGSVAATRVNFEPVSRFVPSSVEQDQIPLMLNPHLPQNQERVLSFVREVVTKYHPDGLLFDDRYRYHGLDADFSESAMAAYEERVKAKILWPDDVYKATFLGTKQTGIQPGRYFDDWLSWRADTMARFTTRVRAEIKRIAPSTQFGIYAGSWYGDYAKYGSNYASEGLQAGFPFLTRSYRQAGFAGGLDLLITGCYYKTSTMYDAMGLGQPIGRTVEAAGDVSNRVARDKCWVYAGIQMIDFAGNPTGFESALQAAAATTQGVMVFDLSHNIENFWPIFERAFRHPAAAPHSVAGLLDKVRDKRAAWDAKGYKERPFPILEGAPGAGF